MTGVSSSFDEFMREMEDEARQAGPEAEAAFFESQQRHWIGRRLFERRRELGYTPAKLSAVSGINQADISKIEHAEANLTLDTLAALATPLGLTLALKPVSEAVRALIGRRGPARVTTRVTDRVTHGRPNRTGAGPRAATSAQSGNARVGRVMRLSPTASDGASPPSRTRRAS